MTDEQHQLDSLNEAYRPPLADADDLLPSVESSFYVIAPSKLITLQFFTLQLYTFYWFYRHWSHLKREQGLRIVPWARALSYVFFTHGLFERMAQGARAARFHTTWNARRSATGFVLITLVGGLLSAAPNVGGLVFTIVVSLASAMQLAGAQRIANRAGGLGRHGADARFSTAEVVATMMGCALWFAYAGRIWLGN
jgi:hypothetical protein